MKIIGKRSSRYSPKTYAIILRKKRARFFRKLRRRISTSPRSASRWRKPNKPYWSKAFRRTQNQKWSARADLGGIALLRKRREIFRYPRKRRSGENLDHIAH